MARRTYGRIYSPTIESGERPLKRRRVETNLSSEASSPSAEDVNTVFEIKETEESDCHDAEDIGLTTDVEKSSLDNVKLFLGPPSPPETPIAQAMKSRKPIFSFLRHEKSFSVSSAFSGKPKKMKQLTLDVGKSPTKSCNECGMTFTPSEKRDVALHISFHAQKVGKAQKLSSRFLQSIEKNVIWTDAGHGEKLIRITKRDELHKRKVVEQILEVVAGDLGSVHLSTSDLWSQESRSDNKSPTKYDKYQVFLFVKDQLCVGLLLAERIDKARRVHANPSADQTSQTENGISATEEFFHAIMGISRIWTSSSFRRAGVASRMLNVASENFQPLMPVRKDLIAFSQPTDMGTRLARKWFKKDIGWLVYDG